MKNETVEGADLAFEIAPIFFNTMEDSGALPIEMDVSTFYSGQLIDVYPYQGITKDHMSGEVLCEWSLKQDTILDSVRANGRINLIIGKGLTMKAQQSLNETSRKSVFIPNVVSEPKKENQSYTLAQKMVGADKIPVPNKHSTDEAVSYTHLTLPTIYSV